MVELLLIILIFVTIAANDKPSLFGIEEELRKITYELKEIKKCLKEDKRDGRKNNK